MHIAIIRNTFTLTGFRAEIPQILFLEEGCDGSEFAVPPALREPPPEIENQWIDICKDYLSIAVVAIPGREILLFVNGQLAQNRISRGKNTFNITRLRAGPNDITVRYADVEDQLAFPFLSHFAPAPFALHSRPSRDFFRELPLPHFEDSSSITVYVNQDLSPSPPKHITSWKISDKASLALYQGYPFAQGRESENYQDDLAHSRVDILLDGFGKVLKKDISIAAEDTPLNRKLVITRTDNGEVTVTISACLPADHILAQWAQSGQVEGPEFVARLYGTQVANWIPFNRELWGERNDIEAKKEPEGWIKLQTTYTVPGGHLWRSGRDTTFPQLPGDELVISGFGKRIQVQGRKADHIKDGTLTWQGSRSALDLFQSLRLSPSFNNLEVGRVLSDEEKTPQYGVFPALKRLSGIIPGLFRGTLWGLSASFPIILIFIVFQGYKTDLHGKVQIEKTKTALSTLLIFTVTLGLWPFFQSSLGSFLLWTNLNSLTWDPLYHSPVGLELYVSFAIISVCLIRALLKKKKPNRFLISQFLERLLFIIFSLFLLLVAGAVLLTQRYLIFPELLHETPLLSIYEWLLESSLCDIFMGQSESLCLLSTLTIFWIVLGLLTLSAPICWLFRAITPNGRIFSSAMLASIFVVLMPVLTGSLLLSHLVSPYFFGLFKWIFTLGKISPIIIGTFLIGLFLNAFREVAFLMLQPALTDKVRRFTRFRYILLFSFIVVLSLDAGFGTKPDALGSTIFRLMTLSQGYAAILALMAPLGYLIFLDQKAKEGQDSTSPFHYPESVTLLLAAAFGGYLTLWFKEPISSLILMVAGFFIFRYVVIGPPGNITKAHDPDLGSRLLTFRANRQLASDRLQSIEKKYSGGSITQDELREHQDTLAKQVEEAKVALRLSPESAKRILLEFGPKTSPIKNAYFGAIAGLCTAAAFQLLLPFDFSLSAGSAKSSWLVLLREALAEPNYKIIPVSFDGSHLLTFINELINAVSLWLITGFLFGYSFHRIRGDDGFVKAIFFGAGIGIPYLLSIALRAEGGGVSPAELKQLVPLLLFLLVLGTLIFDGTTLRDQNVKISRLIDIYGLHTSVGYASLAAIIAALQPLMQLYSWLFG